MTEVPVRGVVCMFLISLFTSTNQYFGPGASLYQTKSSSDDLEVLASRQKIMLINKHGNAVRVRLEGKDLSLEGYEVRVLNASGVSLL